MKHVFGICGKKGSGKSLLARLAREADPRRFEISMAAALKWSAAAFFGRCAWDDALKAEPVPPGPMRQRIRACIRRLGRPPLVVPDIRFPNEVEMIRAMGGAVVRITRASAHTDDGRDTQHASECALDDLVPDYTFENDGTVEELRENLITWGSAD